MHKSSVRVRIGATVVLLCVTLNAMKAPAGALEPEEEPDVLVRDALSLLEEVFEELDLPGLEVVPRGRGRSD